MNCLWLLIGALMLFTGCNNKNVEVKIEVDSVKYFSEQHAKAKRSLDEANRIIDRILKEAQPAYALSMKEGASTTDRLFQLQAVVKENRNEMTRMQTRLNIYRNEARAYEMMAVALKDELEYRDQSGHVRDTLIQGMATEVASPATAKSEVIYINFPDR